MKISHSLLLILIVVLPCAAQHSNQAKSIYRSIIQQDSTQYQALNNLGNEFVQSGNLDSAVVCYQQALRIIESAIQSNADSNQNEYALKEKQKIQFNLNLIQLHMPGKRSEIKHSVIPGGSKESKSPITKGDPTDHDWKKKLNWFDF